MVLRLRKTMLAALDVGSNTVLMLIAEVSGRKVQPIAELLRITRLGRGVDRTGMLDGGAAALTLETIAEFVEQARARGASRIVTAATSALRDARNGTQFIEQVRRRTGVELEIISGQREAQLNYIAAIEGLELDAAQPLLIVDIGGGSTELIRCEPWVAPVAVSLQIGSVRLTERLISHDPPSAAEREQVYDTVRQQLDSLGWNHFRPVSLVGVAGTVTTVAAVGIGFLSQDHSPIHDLRLSGHTVSATAQELFTMTLAERRQLPAMIEGRADVICAGAAILDCITRYFGVSEIIVSNQGVRWGLVYQEIERRGPIIGRSRGSGRA